MTDLQLDQSPRKPTAEHLDERLIEMRSQRYAEKTALGGSRVGNRLSLFLFIGLAAAIAFGVLFYETDRRLGQAVDSWQQAQRVAGSLGVIERSVNAIQLSDRRFAADPSPANAQATQRSLNAIAQAVEDLGSISGGANVSDALVTVRDGFGQFAAQFSALNRVRQEVGYTEDTGLRADRKAAAQDVRAKLKVIGLELSVPDFDRLHGQGAAGATPTAYAALRERIESVSTSDATIAQARADAVALLDRHQDVSGRIADYNAVLAEPPPAVSDIIDYVGPSIRILADHSNELGQTAPADFQAERQRARQIIAGGSAAILAIVVIAGLLLMRTLSRPLDRLATAAARLADGDRSVTIPARGNADQLGVVARSLDAWLDNLTEIDHLRAELDDVRLRLTAESELRAAAETAVALRPEGDRPEVANDTFETAPVQDVPMPEPVLEPEPEPEKEAVPFATETPLPLKRILQGVEREDEAARGTSSPIGTASQELTRFSEFVNAATRDVERTENLMRRLTDTASQIADLEHCVETIRDEAHLLVFRSPSGATPAADDDTLVYISGEAKRGEGEGGGKRFDTIREAVDRAERLVVSVRGSLEQVTSLAQEIASDASSEALDATNKLLSQSEYLQNMLDDLVHKMSPLAGSDKDAGGKSAKKSRGDRD